MARDEDEDLYEDDYDFVDDEEDELDDASDDDSSDIDSSDIDDSDSDDSEIDDRAIEDDADDDRDEFGRSRPATDHVVHIYEYQQFKRTIDRPFTAEDAEAFASEYNRSSKPYGRFAVAGKVDLKPKKNLD